MPLTTFVLFLVLKVCLNFGSTLSISFGFVSEISLEGKVIKMKLLVTKSTRGLRNAKGSMSITYLIYSVALFDTA